MRKIITIAESILDTEYQGGQPVRSFVGGRIPCAAASLAEAGVATFMVSECTTDAVGDIIVGYLSEHRVNVDSIDRYPDGATAFSAIFKDEKNNTTSIVNYGHYPEERFKVIWPRIDKDDIVIIGSLYSVDLPQREGLYEMVAYAAERKAIIIYLPGLQHGINFRITRVMPNILENLEVSNIVIAHEQDINTIFPGESTDEAYRNHIEFYCDDYLHIDGGKGIRRYHNGGSTAYACDSNAANALGWQAGFTAGVAFSLLAMGITHDSLPTLDQAAWQAVMDEAMQWAQASTGTGNCIDGDFAASRQAALAQGLEKYEKSRTEQQ